MPILFVLAGMSAQYALEKRTNKEFVIQRVSKLLIPFISGMIFFVPFQTLYARRFSGNYQKSCRKNFREQKVIQPLIFGECVISI